MLGYEKLTEDVHKVSILVLLDVALKAGRYHRFSAMILGFNPCSLGCCSESWRELGRRLKMDEVSILVLLDVALKVERNGYYVFCLLFQSLFSWMLL